MWGTSTGHSTGRLLMSLHCSLLFASVVCFGCLLHFTSVRFCCPQISRALAATSKLHAMLTKLSHSNNPNNTEPQDLFMLSKNVASQLTTQRYYVRREEGGNKGGDGKEKEDCLYYDPRLLVFEFMQNIVLRQAQVELVRQFRDECITGGSSRCHQMLMGAGKTTVSITGAGVLQGYFRGRVQEYFRVNPF